MVEKFSVSSNNNTKSVQNDSIRNRMDSLSGQIIKNPKSISDFNHNISIKSNLISLAQKQGDSKLVSELQKEISAIRSDMRNFSVFQNKT